MKKLFVSFVLLALVYIAFGQQNPPQPIDSNVRYGKLENGLTYYIRHNKLPKERADFYIAQKVGSMQEEDSQMGLAHFLEHMAFNGLEHFEGKAMLNYLEKIGVKFGENVNAYTGFDETVYSLSNVPVTRESVVDTCLLILHDWSSSISLVDEEIDNERGVIREEWRTRGGAQFRLWEKMLPVMFKGSKYANRLPIGDINIVNNFEYHELRNYYKKWYRPDLQGVIIVGDIDAEKVEQKLKKLFSGIQLDPNRAKREYYPVPDNEETIVSIATDPEATRTSLNLFFKHDVLPDEIKLSQAGLVINYIKSVAARMMNERLQEIVQKPNPPFSFAYSYDDDFFVAKTKDAWTVASSCAEDKIKIALAEMLRETERVKKFGFTESEYERARTNLLKRYENSYNNRDKQRNSSYVSQYVAAFTNNEPIPGIEYEYNMINMIAPNIPLEAVNQTVQQLIGDKNIVLSISGPEKKGLVYPTDAELLAVFDEVKKEEIEPYKEELSDEPLIPNPPALGKIVDEEEDDKLGATVWTLQNGMKVVLKATDFKDDQILMTATSCGGYSPFAQKDPLNSKIMNQIMNLGGVGNFSATNLRKVLAGKSASALPSVSLTTQSMNGSSSIKDFETMMQLVYLYFTSPRSDEDVFQSFVQRMEAQMKNLEAEPRIAFSDSAKHAIYGNNPLINRMKIDELKRIDYARIMNMYKEVFKNPGSFVFTFVGNIDKEKVRPVIQQYLASLPGNATKTDFVKVPMEIRKGKIDNVFPREMLTPKASVFNLFSGTMERNQRNKIILDMIGQTLDILYTEKVREDEGGTYGVSTQGSISRYPQNQTIFQIIYDTDPAKMEHLNKIILDELNLFAQNGPREIDFNKVKKFMIKKYNEQIKENGYWLSILDTNYFYGEDNHSNFLSILESIKSDDLKLFAQKLMAQGNSIKVVMMPKEEKK